MRARYSAAFAISALVHGCLAGALVWPTLDRAPRVDERAVQVVLLPPVEDSTYRGLKPVDRSDSGWKTGDFPAGSQLAGADLDRIAAQVAVLFPFVTPGLALDAFFPGAPSSSRSRLTFDTPFVHPRARPEPRRPLELSPAEVQALVDHIWSRRRRWQAFDPIRKLVETHPADDAQLSLLVRLYREQNALQPYADGPVRDLRLWAQLGLVADHANFIGFIRDYSSSHPSTKVTTELLLLLDAIAQGNEDALAVLVETDQPSDLDWTRTANPRAYDLVRQIQRQYARTLDTAGLTSRRTIGTFYANVRLALLTRTLATTPHGYRGNDLRFLIGSILWSQGQTDEAVRAWRAMSSSPDDIYATAIASLGPVVAATKPDAAAIRMILRNQEGRWAAFEADRLRRFGYRVDRY